MATGAEDRLWTVTGPCESLRGRARWFRRVHGRSILCALALASAFASFRGLELDGTAADPKAAVASVLTARGLTCAADDVSWLDAPRRLVIGGGARALVRAHTNGEPTDLYLVDAHISPEGAILHVGAAHNLTDTSGVDESRPVVRGKMAAYTTSSDGLTTALHVLDLGGRSLNAASGLTRLQRTQIALTNLQQTGQTSGVAHAMYAFEPIARRVDLAFRADGNVEARTDDHVVVIDAQTLAVAFGEAFVRTAPNEHSRPGTVVTWAVDRVRALSWVGDDRMQWVKAVAFGVIDRARVTFWGGTTSDDVRNELGIPSGADAPAPAFVDPDVGWPPPPMVPVASPPLSGEGQWISLDRDPFITPTSTGTAPAFVTSFVRPNAQRPDVRVYATMWDPRQVALHMEAGTVEPISATGEHGSGRIPRLPKVMNRVVAAFNGGFQAQHGEYGMLADGVLYLPPKPYAATVVELRDGSNAFGAWPDAATVPDNVVALRQNLTALVQGGRFNPWGRTWWGGTPPGWPDQVHTARSAVCMTKAGFAGYFYSTSISAEDLGQGMLVAGCSFGIHLDMNPGHAGFEFYNIAPEGQLPPLGRRLAPDWEAEGRVADLPGYAYRSRRMIRAMGHMLFPRYVQREARDFFYLTSRSILPGAPPPSQPAPTNAPGAAKANGWRTKGLPQHGFPYAIATSYVPLALPGAGAEADAAPPPHLRILRVDPRTVVPAEKGPDGAPLVLALFVPHRGAQALWWSNGVFSVAPAYAGPTPAPPSDAVSLAEGFPLDDERAASSRAALGVEDEDGMLVWVELPSEVRADTSTALAMDGLLVRMGCSMRLLVPGDARALPGGVVDPTDSSPASAATALDPVSRLVRSQAPDAHFLYPDTPIVPVQVWQPLQAKRVRYLIKPRPPAREPLAPEPPQR